MSRASPLLVVALLASGSLAAGLRGEGASESCDTWFEQTSHGAGFRNVKDFGAKGDGRTDDTAALLAALTTGRTPKFTLSTPALVYLPAGNYLVRETLPLYMMTHLVGNYKCRPTITLMANSGASYAVSCHSRCSARRLRADLLSPAAPDTHRFPPPAPPPPLTHIYTHTRTRPPHVPRRADFRDIGPIW